MLAEAVLIMVAVSRFVSFFLNREFVFSVEHKSASLLYSMMWVEL
jgi:putative flippase GtrA